MVLFFFRLFFFFEIFYFFLCKFVRLFIIFFKKKTKKTKKTKKKTKKTKKKRRPLEHNRRHRAASF